MNIKKYTRIINMAALDKAMTRKYGVNWRELPQMINTYGREQLGLGK